MNMIKEMCWRLKSDDYLFLPWMVSAQEAATVWTGRYYDDSSITVWHFTISVFEWVVYTFKKYFYLNFLSLVHLWAAKKTFYAAEQNEGKIQNKE